MLGANLDTKLCVASHTRVSRASDSRSSAPASQLAMLEQAARGLHMHPLARARRRVLHQDWISRVVTSRTIAFVFWPARSWLSPWRHLDRAHAVLQRLRGDAPPAAPTRLCVGSAVTPRARTSALLAARTDAQPPPERAPGSAAADKAPRSRSCPLVSIALAGGSGRSRSSQSASPAWTMDAARGSAGDSRSRSRSCTDGGCHHLGACSSTRAEGRACDCS